MFLSLLYILKCQVMFYLEKKIFLCLIKSLKVTEYSDGVSSKVLGDLLMPPLKHSFHVATFSWLYAM